VREKGHLELIEDSRIEDEIPTVEPLVQPVSVTVETDEDVIENQCHKYYLLQKVPR
jgi:hypothetical protein